MNLVGAKRKRSAEDSGNPDELSGILQRHLHTYAMAASAAGVTLLACSLPADAMPIRKNTLVKLVGTDTYPMNPAGQEFAPFNIAHTFANISSLTMSFWNRGFLTPNSAKAAELLADNGFPAALASGASIGPGGHFGKGKSNGMLFSYGPLNSGTGKHHQGNFQFGQINYFGFRFAISGADHYGWVRLKVTFGPGFDGTTTVVHIQSFGYESMPNTSIRAGQCSAELAPGELAPSTGNALHGVREETTGNDSSALAAVGVSRNPRSAPLGLLALGASGLPVWRRKQE